MPPQWDPSLFWMAGMVAALGWLDESARRSALDRRRAFACGLAVVAAAWVGSRLLGIQAYGDAELGPLGGHSWFGALTGGGAAAWIAGRLLDMPLRPWLDAAAPAVCLGYAIGRVGCFINGCDSGAPSSLPWAVGYGPGLPTVHPVQLYSSAGALVLLAALVQLKRFRFGALLIGYGLLRLALEPLRAEVRGELQRLALATLAAGLAWTAVSTRREWLRYA